MTNTMTSLTVNQSFDKEANELLTFLQDFDLATGTSTEDTRRPLATLQPSPLQLQLHNNNKDDNTSKHSHENDNENNNKDDNSLSTCPSLPAKVAARRTWVTRMAQAVRQWKKQHESLTEQRLNEQRQQLQTQHNQQIIQLRQELHQHYENMFLSWRNEYLRSSRTSSKNVEAGPLPKTPLQQQQHHHQRKQWKSPEGKDITCYENGTRREISPDGSSVTRFPNGDIQTTAHTADAGSHDIDDGSPTKLCYFYSDTGILRMDQVDGSVLWCFPNGQRELHKHGHVEVKEWGDSDSHNYNTV